MNRKKTWTPWPLVMMVYLVAVVLASVIAFGPGVGASFTWLNLLGLPWTQLLGLVVPAPAPLAMPYLGIGINLGLIIWMARHHARRARERSQ